MNAMEERNPKEGSSLPTITLGVLVIVVVALLYIGYAYFMDEDAVTLTPQKVETAAFTDASSENVASDVPTPPAVQPEAIDATPTMGPASTTDTATETKKPVAKTEKKEEKKEEKKAEKSTEAVVARGGAISYKVNGGQTFYSIATKYGLSESRLKAANPDVDPSKLQAGKSLKIPVYATHTVGKGDILRVVAQKYGVSVDALMKANGKTKNYVEKGEKLIIPYPKK
ncbi:peptidoglycan-binding protein [Siphonobacter sp. BAB-5385]|uniref:LysM peptidoglycan-binding domain-containing protein n=2 Tax=unclassified Siphonobacter TaxID=2635712 RepID=UPI000B9E201B|nr:LysM domain-containing protein [Siphonobacter sp. BAB-5385]OZI06143.1 peptidoglycan-binding protein [Siphonobacter sp. BAB-5385]PMD94377.1 peptidoglycan-binding protein [Siphonobacter sp. BAB-5405]